MTDSLDAATARAWRQHDPTLPETPDRRELSRRLRRDSLPRALRRRALGAATNTTIGVDGSHLSLTELNAQVQALATALARKGAGPAHPVLLAAPTSLDFIRCYLALLTVRSPVVLANPSATAREFEAQITAASVSAAITGGEASDTLADLASDGSPAHWPISCLETEGGSSLAHTRLPRSGDVAICAFTSGTTGPPKLAPLRHGEIEASIRSAMAAWRWRGDDILVHALPMYHQHGLGGLHAALLSGSSLHCLSRFDPERLVAEAQRRQASVIFAVPAMWERIVGAHSTVDAAHLRLLISGSAPLPATLFERITDVFGQPPLERYGTTESGLNVSNLYDGPRLPGGVGFPLPGVEISIHERTGELSVRGPQVFAGYAGQVPIADDGWFPTGDQAQLDPATGAVTITGRLKDIIITGGMNVHPREVEDVLARHEAVDAVAVVGVPSARWGEEVTAFVVSAPGFTEPGIADPGVTEDELRRWCRRQLSSYKVPKRIHPIAEIPRNPTGKVMRNVLIERGAALAGPIAAGPILPGPTKT